MRDGLVGGNRQVGRFAGQPPEHVRDHRHPRGAADDENPIDLPPVEAGLLSDQRCGFLRPLEQVRGHLLELLPGDFDPHPDAGVKTHGRRLGMFAQGVLQFLGVAPELGGVRRVVAGIQSVFRQKTLGDVVDQCLVEVLAAEADVAVGGQRTERARIDLQQAHVERPAAEVVDQNAFRRIAGARSVHAEQPPLPTACQGRGGWLVDDVENLPAGEPAGVLRRFAAHFVEVGRHGDHRLGKRSQTLFRIALQSLEDQRAEHLGGDVVAVHRTLHRLPAHVAFEAFGIVAG